MPLYEYRCQACNQIFETLRGSHEKDAEVECPQCGEKKADKLISVCGVARGESNPATAGPCGTKKFS